MPAEPVEAKRMIGYVPDSHDVFDRLKGIEYLNFIAGGADRKIFEHV
jgi:ABC-type multidrug transport system ATPase subunit